MARPREPQEHGTRKGYGQHVRRGEPVCDACRTVEVAYQNERRDLRIAEGRQKPRVHVPKVPKVRVYLDPSVIAAFARNSKDPKTVKELRAALNEALEVAKERHGDDLVTRSKEHRIAS